MSKNVKSLEIPIYFHNYKLLKDKEFILKGSHVYFVQGPNDVGKTSFLIALEGVMTAKDPTEKKVTINKDAEGIESGYYEFTIPSADGTLVTIRNEFTDQKNKFTAVTADGEKISQVTEIRNLFNYTPINVSEFFAMSRTADGRRKQRDIILKLLPEDLRDKFSDADLQEQHYFTQRTEIGRDFDSAKSYMDSCVISDDDRELLGKKDQAKQLLSKYLTYQAGRDDANKAKPSIERLEAEKQRLLSRIQDIDAELVQLNDVVKSEEPKEIAKLSDEMISEKIKKGETILTEITKIEAKDSLLEQAKEKHDKLQSKIDDLTNSIEEKRSIKADIVSKADLPVDSISFENDYLTINDFKFDENQVCESDAVLLLANILAKINPGPIQVIGDASILDAKKLEELNKIAEENDKVMFVDEVIRDATDMVVVGYDQISTSKIPKKGKAKPPTKPKAEKPEAAKAPTKDDDKNENKDEPLF